MAGNTLKDIPFVITLDVNRYTVAFHFNDRFEELADLPDVTFPCFDPNVPFEETNEETNETTFRELIRQAAAEQK